MRLPHPRPWKITDTGSAFRIADAGGRSFALARPYPAERMRIVQEGFDKVDRYKALAA